VLKIIFSYFCQCLCVFCELGGSNDSVSENRVVGSYQRVKLAKLLPSASYGITIPSSSSLNRTVYQDFLGRLRGLVGERFAAKRSVASR
jgi:hypothetical protein